MCCRYRYLYNNQSSFWIFIGQELWSIRGQTHVDAISATSQSQRASFCTDHDHVKWRAKVFVALQSLFWQNFYHIEQIDNILLLSVQFYIIIRVHSGFSLVENCDLLEENCDLLEDKTLA